MSIIKVENLYKSFGDLEVLKGINLELNKGDIFAIIGSSGSGKSTLLRCMINLEQIDSGDIFVADELFIKDGTYAAKESLLRLRLKMGMVFQHFNLFPHLTVRQNLELPCRLVKKIDAKHLREQSDMLLTKIGLTDKADVYPSNLSGGQKQRVAIVRALMMQPEIIFFDEPTSSLDPEITSEVLESMRALAKDRMTMIIVTHEISFAREIADKVLFMHNGVIEEVGTPDEIFRHPKSTRLIQFLKNVR